MENRSGESAGTSRILRTDDGGEYTSVNFREYLKSQEVRHEHVTIPKCPEQNRGLTGLLSKCGIAGENQPSGAKTQNGLFIPCCSPYFALSSGACGTSICASVPEL